MPREAWHCALVILFRMRMKHSCIHSVHDAARDGSRNHSNDPGEHLGSTEPRLRITVLGDTAYDMPLLTHQGETRELRNSKSFICDQLSQEDHAQGIFG